MWLLHTHAYSRVAAQQSLLFTMRQTDSAWRREGRSDRRQRATGPCEKQAPVSTCRTPIAFDQARSQSADEFRYNLLTLLVGASGFEPETSCAQVLKARC